MWASWSGPLDLDKPPPPPAAAAAASAAAPLSTAAVLLQGVSVISEDLVTIEGNNSYTTYTTYNIFLLLLQELLLNV